MSRSLSPASHGVRPSRRSFGLWTLLALHRQRRALAGLDAQALKDIGVTRAQARKEAARAPWDVPARWLR